MQVDRVNIVNRVDKERRVKRVRDENNEECLPTREPFHVSRLTFHVSQLQQITSGTNKISFFPTKTNYNKRIHILFISYLLYALFYLTLLKPQSLTANKNIAQVGFFRG
jgi:hypothetical protein